MKPVDDIAFWREKAMDWETLYREQKQLTEDYKDRLDRANYKCQAYKDALHDIMHYEADKRAEIKENIRVIEDHLL